MAEKEKLNLFDEKVRKKLAEEITRGFYYHPEEMKKWHRILLAIQEFLKENPDLKTRNPEIYRNVLDLLRKFKWFSFPFLTSSEIVTLFKDNFKFALSQKNYPLEENLHIFLLEVPLLDLREEFKEKMRNNLLGNNEKITSFKIKINNEELEPTISNWLNLYNKKLGSGKVDTLKLAEFLTKEENIKKLPPEEKAIVERLFKIYEELKLSPLEVEGLEEAFYAPSERGIELHRRGKVEEVIKPEFPLFKKQISEKPKEETKTSFKGDEKEIEEMKKKIPEIKKEISYDKAIDNVIKENSLTFEDKILENRFRNIVLSYLKDIRDEILTKENLTRSKKIGGMGYDEKLAEKIVSSLQKQKPKVKIEKPKEVKIPDLAEGLSTPKDMVIEEEFPTKEVLKEEIVPKKEIEPIKEKIEKPSKAPEKKEEIAQQKKYETGTLAPPIELPVEMEKREIPFKKEEEKKEKPPMIHRLSEELEKIVKPKTEEVKVTPKIKVYGPIDELRSITLEDWRRYPNNEIAVSRIKEKIDLLEEESITKKAEGIKAWKDSEVNRLYLEITQQAIEQKKPIEKIIEERKSEGKPTLTVEEFNAIAKLNQTLRF